MRSAVTVIVHDYRGVGTRHDIMTFLPEEPPVRLLNGEHSVDELEAIDEPVKSPPTAAIASFT